MQHIENLSVLAAAELGRINELPETHAPAFFEGFPSDSAGSRYSARHLKGLKLLHTLTHQEHVHHQSIPIQELNAVPDWQVPHEAEQGYPSPDR